MQPKILVFDLETLPNLGYFWDCYPENGIPLQFVVQPKAICTIAYKWMGENKSYVLKVKEPYNDKEILKKFLPVWEEADYVLGHFGDGFDIPYLAGRLLANGLPPLPIVPSIDTYKLAKKHFGKTLNSNRLDNLGTVLNVGNKNKTNINLWVNCASGNKKAIDEMGEYNRQDVNLLEQVALKMLPYTGSKLNRRLFSEAEISCETCGSTNIQKRGTLVTKTVKKRRVQCQDCGHWGSIKYEEDEIKTIKINKRKQSTKVKRKKKVA